MASAPTVAIRVYFRGKPDGEIRHIPARFFRWHPAYHGRKSYTATGSSLGGQLERARDAYVNKIAPGNVGWEEVYSSTHYEKAARTNPGPVGWTQPDAAKVGGLTNWRWRSAYAVGWITVESDRDGDTFSAEVRILNRDGRTYKRQFLNSFPTLAAAKAFVERTDRRWRPRGNPGLGMPGRPHTWVTKSGVHVSGGDTVEYWSKEGLARDAKPERRRAKVNRMLVFSDHVMVSRGQFGNYVSDDNFIRVVRKGG
jgi:hypothetical protein